MHNTATSLQLTDQGLFLSQSYRYANYDYHCSIVPFVLDVPHMLNHVLKRFVLVAYIDLYSVVFSVFIPSAKIQTFSVKLSTEQRH